MLRDIYLYGELADNFGPHHRLDVRSIKEMMWAMDVNHDGRFFPAIRKDQSYQVVYGDTLEADPLSEIQLTMLFGPGSFHLAPVIEGSGGGGTGKAIGMAVIGVALIATGVGAGLAGMGAAGSFGAAMAESAFMGISWGTIAMAGGVLALGGVSRLLSPTPDVASYDTRDETPKSYMFNGPVNTIEQGSCIPVVFGKHWIGSTVVSAGITVYEGTDTQGDFENPPQTGTTFTMRVFIGTTADRYATPTNVTVVPILGDHPYAKDAVVTVTATSSSATADWMYIYVNGSVVCSEAITSAATISINVTMYQHTSVEVIVNESYVA